MSKSNQNRNFMESLATVIVDKRSLIFLIVIIGFIFSIFSSGWVEVENDLKEYLPVHSETRQGLDIMEEEFITYGTAQVMVANISLEKANLLYDELCRLKGVQSITFDEEQDYADVSAKYTITFDYSEKDDSCLTALDSVKEHLSQYDVYVSTSLGNSSAEIIDSEVNLIMVLVAVIVVAVLLFTCESYGEVPVLLLTFVSAMILNQGTNFLLGKISFVSNSVTSILQLALSLDYAVILSNRFREEREHLELRDAVIAALSKGIPEIGASSLTTIGGLCAMLFMQFRIGPDMAISLIKAVIFALLSVFVIMPGLLMLFGPWIDRTRHRSFVPKIPFVGKFAFLTRYVVPPVFVVLMLLGFHFSADCPYVYGYGEIETPKQNYVQEADDMIASAFGATNFVAMVYPKTDYSVEAAMLEELDTYDEVDYSMGLSNVEAMDGYMLADRLTPRQFAELADLDYEAAQVVYAAYAAAQEEYGEILGNLSTYSVPLIDMMLFVCEQIDNGILSLDEDQTRQLLDAKTQMQSAKNQLQGESYNRVLVYLNLPEGGEETYAFLDTMREIGKKYYPDGEIYLVGDSTVEQDFKLSFATDNTVVTIVSILIVLVVLLFTFKSAAMPLLLIMVIQGAIWISFSIPVFTQEPLFFMSYLVVSSIQMGANIDYAIVIASRYQEIKGTMDHKTAIVETMNFTFHTILTSGSILTIAGILIGNMTSEAAIVGIGQSLGRGTLISIFLVMFVLPQILLIGSGIADKTSFSVKALAKTKQASGRVRVDGLVRGEINGYVNGIIRGDIDGTVDLHLISGEVSKEGECNEEE